MTYSINHNETFGSLEITFDGKPSETVRAALKALRFRWHGVKKLWYGYADEQTARAAIDGAEPVEAAKVTPIKAAAPAEKVNKYGVKVGDLFTASWGYDQTNVDFFQVIALVGESSVRVREVNPPMLNEEATGPMAADFTYQTKGLPILPASSFSVFIKDQDKGDLKRLKSYAADGRSCPQFSISSYASAHLCDGNTTTVYESWYA